MKIVVVGNGMVGYKFCEKLMTKNDHGQFEITAFGEEARPAYDRVHLSEYFSGKSEDDLSLAPAEWYLSKNIKLHLGDPVTRIDRINKVVHSHHGIAATYDYLVLATGSSAFVPPIPGIEKQGVFIYRTIDDLELMTSWAKKAKKGAGVEEPTAAC